jgi:hypothetical protein
MAEIVYDGSGNAFEVRSGGASVSGTHRSLRGAMDHARSVSGILGDAGNRDALARALANLGACSPAEAPTLSHEEVRALAKEALGSGALVLVPHVRPRRPLATVLDREPAPRLSELAPREPEVKPRYTVELSLVDAKGQPVPGEEYRVELPDGRVVEGRLDARGVALVTGIESKGTCRVNFPRWDKDCWKAV